MTIIIKFILITFNYFIIIYYTFIHINRIIFLLFIYDIIYFIIKLIILIIIIVVLIKCLIYLYQNFSNFKFFN